MVVVVVVVDGADWLLWSSENAFMSPLCATERTASSRLPGFRLLGLGVALVLMGRGG